jgi:hypothetical protein
MARLFSTITDTTNAYFKKTTHVTPLKYAIELAALGVFGRNQYMGGSAEGWSLDLTSAGDLDLQPVSLRFLVDNTNSQITNSASVVVRVRYYLRVSSAVVSLTPKILKSTDDSSYSAATISGQAACTGTATNFSGTNQKQTVLLTLDAGLRYYRPQVTVGGAPATGLEGWAYALFDCYCAV